MTWLLLLAVVAFALCATCPEAPESSGCGCSSCQHHAWLLNKPETPAPCKKKEARVQAMLLVGLGVPLYYWAMKRLGLFRRG